MCHVPLTVALSLPFSLPPPALSPYPLLSIWTSLKLFLLFSTLTPTLRSKNNFEQFCNCWPYLLFPPPLFSPLLSSTVKLAVHYHKAALYCRLHVCFIYDRMYMQMLHQHKGTAWIQYCLFPSYLIPTRPACPRFPLVSTSNSVVYQSDSSSFQYWSRHFVSQQIPRRELTETLAQKVDGSQVLPFRHFISNVFSRTKLQLCAFKGESHNIKQQVMLNIRAFAFQLETNQWLTVIHPNHCVYQLELEDDNCWKPALETWVLT